jgi:succinate dehydrogenase/fumarate reductase flavoprotein subunit
LGQTDIIIVTDNLGGGTSNNTGSDKQTYYKLSLSGEEPDSVLDMARDLFRGGCMHGDIALCEAQNSAQAFYHLVRLGVPFPHDRFGAYVGYKTDHDPRQRATSAGPLTSQLMCAALLRAVRARNILILDKHEVIHLLTQGNGSSKKVVGALALENCSGELDCPGYVVFNAVNVILGTGGPAGIYRQSVYPECQLGSTGMALAAGAVAHNLTESQFGLASIRYRWNLSGTYQQVIPRYISTDRDGKDEREFLNDFFPDMGKLSTAIFLKGYQWPFDPRKLRDFGSSLIDILVYRETVQQSRRVFLDFQNNPSGAGTLEDFAFELLSSEAFAYLEKSGALLDTPIDRLQKMNQPAIDLYRENGIDLTRERLEIAVCAQHSNGGLKGNIWWESNLSHLFPVGEVNGTHGVSRPGGSALNSGQVGGLRAALYIARNYGQSPPEDGEFMASAGAQLQEQLEFGESLVMGKPEDDALWQKARQELQERMTAFGSHIRDPRNIQPALTAAWDLYRRLKTEMRISSAQMLSFAYKNLDLALTHALYLEAIAAYLEKSGGSRGSYLVLDPEGEKPCESLDEEWRFRMADEDDFVSRHILELTLTGSGDVGKNWVDIRPLPESESWFETVWEEYRNGHIIK